MNREKEKDVAFPEDVIVDALLIVRGRRRKSAFTFEGERIEIPARKSVVVVQTAQGEITAIPWDKSYENKIGEGRVIEMGVDQVNRLTPPAFKQTLRRALSRAPKIPFEPVSSK